MSQRINNVVVLGTGVLGSQIAFQTAYCGVDVVAYDLTDDILQQAKGRLSSLAETYRHEVPGAAGGKAAAALERVSLSSDLTEAVANADLVIEAVPEDMQIKRDTYRKLAEVAEMVDETWKIATGAPLGPFQIYDLVGLTTPYNITKAGDADSQRLAAFLKDNYINADKLGVVSGEGFYKYAAS